MRTAGRHTVHLWVLRDNARGIRFYRAAGFQPAPVAAKVLEIGGRRVEQVCMTHSKED
jgi:RimJ/RimL family protein N-acetyltransferase